MKKILFLSACVIFIAAFTSCDTKRCYCYQQVGGIMVEDETYTDLSTACDYLSTPTRHCVEESQRMPASDIAREYKKR